MSQLLQILTDTAVFHRRHKAVAVMVWLTSSIATTVLTVPHRIADIPAFAVIATLMGATVMCLLARYEKVLDARIAAPDGGPAWQVQINGVAVGEMKDADYAAIRRAVHFDGRLYLAQLLSLGGVALRMVDYLFTAIPLGVFWLVIGCFFLVPQFFAEALSAIQKVTPAQAATAMPMLAQILVLAAVLTFGAHVLIGRRFSFFGFANKFDQACSSRVRRAVACAADGEVSLYRFEGDTFIAPDELATVFTKR